MGNNENTFYVNLYTDDYSLTSNEKVFNINFPTHSGSPIKEDIFYFISNGINRNDIFINETKNEDIFYYICNRISRNNVIVYNFSSSWGLQTILSGESNINISGITSSDFKSILFNESEITVDRNAILALLSVLSSESKTIVSESTIEAILEFTSILEGNSETNIIGNIIEAIWELESILAGESQTIINSNTKLAFSATLSGESETTMVAIGLKPFGMLLMMQQEF